MGGVGTPIIGRPRPLPRQRRADHPYTLNCEEPNYGRINAPPPAPSVRSAAVSLYYAYYHNGRPKHDGKNATYWWSAKILPRCYHTSLEFGEAALGAGTRAASPAPPSLSWRQQMT